MEGKNCFNADDTQDNIEQSDVSNRNIKVVKSPEYSTDTTRLNKNIVVPYDVNVGMQQNSLITRTDNSPYSSLINITDITCYKMRENLAEIINKGIIDESNDGNIQNFLVCLNKLINEMSENNCIVADSQCIHYKKIPTYNYGEMLRILNSFTLYNVKRVLKNKGIIFKPIEHCSKYSIIKIYGGSSSDFEISIN